MKASLSRLDALHKALASTNSNTQPSHSRSEEALELQKEVDPGIKNIPEAESSAEVLGEDEKDGAWENDETECLSEPQTDALSRKIIITLICEYVHPNPFIEYHNKSKMPANNRPFSLEARVE
jgi:hypothetical protein